MVAVLPRGTGHRPPLFSSFLLVLSMLFAAPAWAGADEGQRFLAVSLNEVSGDPPDHDRLAAFFDWLSNDGWTAITLDDVERARRGERPLPDRAILLTFDNGYRDLYLRVFPLAQRHGMPIVASLAGDRVEAGDERFVTWDQAREMQDSGLVEFAVGSFVSDELLTSSDDVFRDRLRTELQRSREQLRLHLGRAPRAVACPYGRCSPAAQGLASELGFGFALSLEPELASTARPMAIGRYLPLNTPAMGYFPREAIRQAAARG